MARKDKYNKLKPEISPITLMIVGLVFLGLILTIVLSLPTKREKFNKKYNFEDNNNYKVVTLKKLEKEIKAGKDVLVVINTPAEESNAITIIQEIDKAHAQAREAYEENKVSDSIKVIYFVDLKVSSDLNDFVETYEITGYQSTLLLAFKNKELVLQFDEDKLPSGSVNSGETLNLIIRNVKGFFEEFTTLLEEK